MGGYRRRGRRSSSFFSMFMGCCSGGSEDDQYYSWDDAAGRICPSDEDRVRWVGDRRIDSKASAFIARFHESRVLDSEQQYAV